MNNFVKWAGGKHQLLGDIINLADAALQQPELCFVESFVGGGAVLFYVLEHFPNIQYAVINDVNTELITCYRVIKEQPGDLIAKLENLKTGFLCAADKEAFYFQQRELFNTKQTSALDTAALFIFLNRTCFNGLYRVNSKGLFNVPFGKYENPMIYDKETIEEASKLLKKVEILNGDFEETVKKVKTKNAFFYFDPPYRPLPNTASFVAYDKSGFNDDQQKRLKNYCDLINSLGYKFVLSNSDPKNTDENDNFFDDLFCDYEVSRVFARRNINSKASGRGNITEILVTNIK